METQIVPERMDVHLPDTLRIVACFGKFACECMFIPPGNVVFVSDPSVMALFHAGVKSGAGGNTAWTGAVRAVKIYTPGSQSIKIWGLYIRMSCISKSVSPELICHK